MPHARIVVAVGVAGLAAAAPGCFSSSNPPSSSGDDAATVDDAPAEADGALRDGSPGVDAPVEANTPRDASADATPEVDATVDAPAEAASDGGGLDASPTDAGEAGMPADAGGGLVRVADMAPDLASIDFCVKGPDNASFAGPYMWLHEGLTLSYKAVSEYDALAQASGYTVRIVAGGATDCSTGLVPDVAVGPSPSTAPTTVVLEGTGSDAGTLSTLALTDDDPSTAPAGKTRMRAVHAAPSVGSVSYEIGVAPYTDPLQAGVVFGATFAAATAATGAPTPDSQGYIEPDYGQAQVTVLLGGVETTSFYVGNGNAPTASSTAFLVGVNGSGTDPLGFVNCDELGAADGSTHQSPCTFSSAAPGTCPLRVFHGSPDQGSVDLCAGIGPVSQPFSGNLLQTAGISGGMAFGQLTGDIATLPAGTDVKIGFASDAATCANGQFLTVGTGLPPGEWTFAMFESELPPSTTYDAYLYFSQIATSGSVALVNFANLTPIGSGPNLDFFVTETGSTETEIGQPAMGPESQTGFVSLTADTYALRVEDDDTQSGLYTTTGAQLSADESYLVWWLQGSAAQGILARCPLGQRNAGALTSCAQ
jgi:hypothetical protein